MKLKLSLLLFALLATTACTNTSNLASDEDVTYIFPARNLGKWGFIDQRGQMVITAKYDRAESFQEGLAPVRLEVNRVRKWGFVNEKDSMVIAPQFEAAACFSEGLAAVQVGQLYGFIDHEGRMVIEPKFVDVGSFHEGMAWFEDSITRKKGFIDKEGKVAIEPVHGFVQDFRNGTAFWGEGNSCGIAGRGLMDRKGELVPGADETNVSCAPGYYIYSEDRLIFSDKDHKEGFKDRDGKVIAEPQFSRVESYKEGLAAVELDSKWGFLDHDGKMAIAPQFYSAASFSHGLARVQFDNWKMGYIDKAGKVIFKEK